MGLMRVPLPRYCRWWWIMLPAVIGLVIGMGVIGPVQTAADKVVDSIPAGMSYSQVREQMRRYEWQESETNTWQDRGGHNRVLVKFDKNGRVIGRWIRQEDSSLIRQCWSRTVNGIRDVFSIF
jgi:hypothetical protein